MGTHILATIARERFRGFPQDDFNDRETPRFRFVEDQLRDILGRGVVGDQEERLKMLAEDRHHRIGLIQNHAVIEFIVDPGSNGLFNVREVDEHPSGIEFGGLQRDQDAAIVPVQMTAFAGIVQQPVPVTEIDFLRDAKHDDLEQTGGNVATGILGPFPGGGNRRIGSPIHHRFCMGSRINHDQKFVVWPAVGQPGVKW